MGGPVATRRAVLGAVAAVPLATMPTITQAASLQPAWDAAYRDFRLKDALRRANDKFGHGVDRDEAFDRLRYRLTGSVGAEPYKRRPSEAEEAELRAALQQEEKLDSADYHRFVAPADAAALALVMLPAPDVEAVDIKVDVIATYELNSNLEAAQHVFDIVEADVARLAAERR